MEAILRMRHWQMFLLAILLFFFKILTTFWFGRNIGHAYEIFERALIYGWYLSIGYILNRKLPLDLRLNFKPILIIGIAVFILTNSLPIFFDIRNLFSFEDASGIIWIMMLLVLFIVSLKLVTFPFKVLNMIEKQRDVDINEYFGDILLFGIWPIGVWFIQPRFNAVATK